MKNKIILLLSLAFLLTSLNAFAKKMTSQKTTIMDEEIKTFLQNAYEENKTRESTPEAEIKAICKDDKYCLEYAEFIAFPEEWKDLPYDDTFENLVEVLKNDVIKKPKQELYNLKYKSSTNHFVLAKATLIEFEASKLKKLTTFDEIKEYVLDMPLTYSSFISALKKMKTTARSKEELDFVDSFIKKYSGKLFRQDYENFKEADFVESIKSSNPFCPESLIVDNYGYDNLCILPFPFVIEENGFIRSFKNMDVEKFKLTSSNPKYKRRVWEKGKGIDPEKIEKFKKRLQELEEKNKEIILVYFELDR